MTKFEKVLDGLEERDYCLARRLLLENAGEIEYEACAARATNALLRRLSALRRRHLVDYDPKTDVWRPTDEGASGPSADALTRACVEYSAIRNLTEKLKRGA